MNFNKTIIAGHITADIDLRHTPSGKPCANFTLAATRRYKNDQGQKIDQTLFIECAAWGTLGEHIAKHKGKGDNILVEGFLQTDSWEDRQTGQKRSKIKIIVEKVEFGKRNQTRNDEGDTSFLD